MRRLLLLSCLLLTACDGGKTTTSVKKDFAMDPLTSVNAKLAFTCKHEAIPDAPAEADILFKYARWLQKNNLLKQDKTVDAETERLYRIAAENGHFKANINLQNGSIRGQFSLSADERFRLSQRLINAKIASVTTAKLPMRGIHRLKLMLVTNYLQPKWHRMYPDKCFIVPRNREMVERLMT